MIHEGRVESISVSGSAWLRFGLQGGKGSRPAACPYGAKVLGAYFKRLLKYLGTQF